MRQVTNKQALDTLIHELKDSLKGIINTLGRFLQFGRVKTLSELLKCQAVLKGVLFDLAIGLLKNHLFQNDVVDLL